MSFGTERASLRTRHLLAGLAVLLLAFGLTACKRDTAGQTPAVSGEAIQTARGEGYVFAPLAGVVT